MKSTTNVKHIAGICLLYLVCSCSSNHTQQSQISITPLPDFMQKQVDTYRINFTQGNPGVLLAVYSPEELEFYSCWVSGKHQPWHALQSRLNNKIIYCSIDLAIASGGKIKHR